MEISAKVVSSLDGVEVRVATGASLQTLAVPAKATGRGSAVNGGEFLTLAVATCYCNDLYREAERLGIAISACEVIATALFNGIGQGAASIRYAARVESSAAQERIEQLLSETDRRAEVHNTLRAGCAVERVARHDPAD